ncbi:MAG: response regulator [Pleomorphochaeta sp.]
MEKVRILIAEDIDIIREDLEQTINSQDDMIVVASVATGLEAQKKAKTVIADIAILDVEMESNTAGIIAANFFQENYPSVKVIYLSVHENSNIILTAMATGAIDYIVKGCSDEILLDHIRKASKGETNLESKVQKIMMEEYKRLRKSEKSLNFFIENLSTLTPTEKILVGYLLKGYKVKEIAKQRNVEIVTVKTQITILLKKFNCRRTSKITEMINELNLSHLFLPINNK